jgi:hypothetical protein
MPSGASETHLACFSHPQFRPFLKPGRYLRRTRYGPGITIPEAIRDGMKMPLRLLVSRCFLGPPQLPPPQPRAPNCRPRPQERPRAGPTRFARGLSTRSSTRARPAWLKWITTTTHDLGQRRPAGKPPLAALEADVDRVPRLARGVRNRPRVPGRPRARPLVVGAGPTADRSHRERGECLLVPPPAAPDEEPGDGVASGQAALPVYQRRLHGHVSPGASGIGPLRPVGHRPVRAGCASAHARI